MTDLGDENPLAFANRLIREAMVPAPDEGSLPRSAGEATPKRATTAAYRVFPVGPSNHVADSGAMVSCRTDAEALEAATAVVTADNGAEIWQGARMVARLPALRVRK